MGKQYNGEFKQDAVKLADQIGVKQAAERLGVPKQTLLTWVRNSKKPVSKPYKELKAGESVEAGFIRLLVRCRNWKKPMKY